MYITAFRCTIDAIQKALLGVMSKTDHSNDPNSGEVRLIFALK